MQSSSNISSAAVSHSTCTLAFSRKSVHTASALWTASKAAVDWLFPAEAISVEKTLASLPVVTACNTAILSAYTRHYPAPKEGDESEENKVPVGTHSRIVLIADPIVGGNTPHNTPRFGYALLVPESNIAPTASGVEAGVFGGTTPRLARFALYEDAERIAFSSPTAEDGNEWCAVQVLQYVAQMTREEVGLELPWSAFSKDGVTENAAPRRAESRVEFVPGRTDAIPPTLPPVSGSTAELAAFNAPTPPPLRPRDVARQQAEKAEVFARAVDRVLCGRFQAPSVRVDVLQGANVLSNVGGRVMRVIERVNCTEEQMVTSVSDARQALLHPMN